MIKKAEEVNRKNTALTTQVSDLKEDLHTKDALLKMARDENVAATPPEVQVP